MSSSAPDRRTLIIGYGNPLRSDDRAGWHIAEQLRARLAALQVDILTLQLLTPELSDDISRSARVFFLDASEGPPPGTVDCRHITIADVGPRPLTHHMSPESLLHMAQQLFGHAPPATLYTVAGGSFEHGETLSAPVRIACDALVETILRELQ